jgi:hypothetical protein
MGVVWTISPSASFTTMSVRERSSTSIAKEHDHFRGYGFRPEDAYGRRLNPGSTPPNDGEAVVHRMAAINGGCNQDHHPKAGKALG